MPVSGVSYKHRCCLRTVQFVMGSLAMKATERDPDFLANFGKALGGNKRKTSEWRRLAGFERGAQGFDVGCWARA